MRIAIRNSIDFKSIGEFASNKQKFEAAGITVQLASMTHVPVNPAYYLNPEAGELGNLSGNFLYNIPAAMQLISAAGYSAPIDCQYWVLPNSDGQIPQDDQLTIDSLSASGVFKVSVMRNANSVDNRNCRSLGQCDGFVTSGSGTDYDIDRVMFRDFDSQGNPGSSQAYPDPRIDALVDKERSEFDVEKRIGVIKDFQMLEAQLFSVVPFTHLFTTFSFRWPWVHNTQWGLTTGAGLPPGRPVGGAFKQWLDPNMPNRNG